LTGYPKTARDSQVQIVELIGPVVWHAGRKDFVISCQHPLPVAVKVPLDGDAGITTSAFAQPGIFLQSPCPPGGARHNVTSVGCAEGAQTFGFRVALTALAPPGSRTSSGGVRMYWQPADSGDSSSGEAVATPMTPPQAPARVTTAAADTSIERRTVISAS
jgi:hypothetical protein